LVGRVEQQRLGTSIAPLGDVDGDGRADLLIGSNSQYASAAGSAVYSSAFGFSTPTEYCVGSGLTWTGSTSVAANDLVLTVSLPANSSGRLIGGTQAGGGTADLHAACVFGRAIRIGPPLPLGGSGQAAFTLLPSDYAAVLTAGTTWHFQFAYQTGTSSFLRHTNALALTLVP
jgi:hypothetical protein